MKWESKMYVYNVCIICIYIYIMCILYVYTHVYIYGKTDR